MAFITLNGIDDGQHSLDSDKILHATRPAGQDFTIVTLNESMGKMVPPSLEVKETPAQIASAVNLTISQNAANAQIMIEDMMRARGYNNSGPKGDAGARPSLDFNK